MNEERLARFVSDTERKHWGKYRAFVENRNDPKKLGRLKVKVPHLLGDVATGWAWPVVPYAGANVGFFSIPAVGDMVWVEFLDGELDQPIWTGGAWGMPGRKSEIPEEAKANYPDTHVLRTKSGHTITLDDSRGNERLTLRAKNGCEIVLDATRNAIVVKAGTVSIESEDGKGQALATEAFVKTVFNMHAHQAGPIPTSAPIKVAPDTPVPDGVPFTADGSLTTVLKAQ
jgi:uncharacterized protein involved in type VI secretion and phage assembly